MADDDSRRPSPGATRGGDRPGPDASASPRPHGRDDVWGATSYLVAGPLTFGALGFGLDHLLGTAFFGPVGIIGGIVLAVWYVWFRYGDAGEAISATDRPSRPHPRTHDDVRAEETT
ncbi:AtpZ/AtpI family protein [Pseudokineococcus basanitobsidens]|uniref:AtpZ/AtpI family protein n=1 Tax=Pseudokineococcus basanitobsidens TaxID=1926649 RepID=A0ABU8RIF4_9ACTN